MFLLLLWADFLVLSPAPLALGLLLDRPAADDGIAQAMVGLRGSVRTERDARAESREGFHQNIAQLLSKWVHSATFARLRSFGWKSRKLIDSSNYRRL